MTTPKKWSDLLREERSKATVAKLPDPPVIKEDVLPPQKSVNISMFLAELAQEKRQQKEELREKAKDVIPKLGDFFSMLSSDKKDVATVSTALDSVVTEDDQIITQIEAVEQAANDVTQITNFIEENKDQPVTQEDTSSIIELKTQLEEFVSKWKKEVDSLKKMIQSSPRTIVHQTAGGGEVLFAKLDDVLLHNLTDGDMIVYDDAMNRFVNRQPSTSSTGIVGGTANQVLVKRSASNFDYEWQDMIITPQAYTKLVDDTVPGVMYVGEAVPTSSQTSPSWRIQKIIFDTNGNVDSIFFANSGNFNQIWINRYTLSYS